MIDIVAVGKQKVNYKDHSNIEFESLSFYLDLAKKAISKFGKNFSSNISKEMLNSEDAIANVANCIMMADWRWDSDRKGITGQQKTKYSYRNQCAIWAIKSYMTRKKQKNSKSHAVSVDTKYNDEELNLLDIVPDRIKSPIDELIEQENKFAIKAYLDEILDTKNRILSDRQAECLKLYYIEDWTFAQIGKKFNITREAIRQTIKKALEKIRNLA